MFTKNTRVLVVDDMRVMRTVVKKVLRDIGFVDITEATDGKEAWNMIQAAERDRRPFGLIVSDWNMPNMKGIELLKTVRGTPSTQSLPFILITAEAEREQVIEAIQAGVDDYVTKPFTAQTVRQKLANIKRKRAGGGGNAA